MPYIFQSKLIEKTIRIICESAIWYRYALSKRIKFLRQKCYPDYFDNLIWILPLGHLRLPVSKAITSLSSPVADCTDMIKGTLSICITVAGNIKVCIMQGNPAFILQHGLRSKVKTVFPDITIPIIIRSWGHLIHSIIKETSLMLRR